MSTYTHTPQGLALYFGADCEYEWPFENPGGGCEWVPDTCAVGHELLSGDYEVRSLVLFLRPLSSMTEEESQECKSAYKEAFPDDVGEFFDLAIDCAVTPFFTDWLRSNGFDLGGPCLKDGQPVWVESFIDVGLAKEVGS